MKIIVLSDIHGNDIALKEVLNNINIDLQLDWIFVLGDVAGYYYNVSEVIKILQQFNNVEIIQGNHERMLLEAKKNPRSRDLIYKKYGSGINYALETLNEKEIEYLCNNPTKKKLNIDNLEFELCHGSPWDEDLYVYKNSDQEILQKCASSKSDFVLMGHTHYQFMTKINTTTIVNPGSVGQSRMKGGIANWAIINTNNKTVELKSTKYKVDDLILEVKKRDPQNPYLVNILLRN
jgi:putative phosphoesterase